MINLVQTPFQYYIELHNLDEEDNEPDEPIKYLVTDSFPSVQAHLISSRTNRKTSYLDNFRLSEALKKLGAEIINSHGHFLNAVTLLNIRFLTDIYSFLSFSI